MGRSSLQASANQSTAKQVLLSTPWRDPDGEDRLCLEETCDKYYLTMSFSNTAMTHTLYDKVTKKKVAGGEKVYGIRSLDNDSFIRTSDAEVGTYEIHGSSLQVCFQGEGCFSFYRE